MARHRPTNVEMEQRYATIIDIVEESAPTSVRHAYYAAIARGLVEKDTAATKRMNYGIVQRAILNLRRAGDIPYEDIVDSTRWMLKRASYFDIQQAAKHWAQTYRRDHWLRGDVNVEVWCESQSIAGVLQEITADKGVALFPTKGYSSETFAYGAAMNWRDGLRDPVVLYVGDLDLHGKQIEKDLRTKLEGFYGESVIWSRVGLTEDQVARHHLEGFATKSGHWEAEALPPDLMREYLVDAIDAWWDAERFASSLAAEESEREIAKSWAEIAGRSA
jgi:hypothetical protein